VRALQICENAFHRIGMVPDRAPFLCRPLRTVVSDRERRVVVPDALNRSR